MVRDSWLLRTGSSGCPKTSVSNYNYTLCNSLEERGSLPIRGGSLKSTLNLFTLLSELSLLSNYANYQRRPEWKKKSQYSWKHKIESVLLFCITPFPGVEPAHSGTNTAWLSLLCYVWVLSWNTVPWGRETASCLCDKRLNLGTELDFASRSWFKNNAGQCQRGLLFLFFFESSWINQAKWHRVNSGNWLRCPDIAGWAAYWQKCLS